MRESGYVSVTHHVLIDAAPDEVWEWNNAASRTLQSIVQFENYPAVVGTTPLIGDWQPGGREGNRRRVEFADGHYLAEEALVDTRETFRYMIWGFTNAQRFAVSHGLAEFSFAAEGDRTRLTWTYSFLPATNLLRPAVARFLTRTMSPMMTATLAAVRTGIETDIRDGAR